MIILGLTGRNASGKGEVARLLEARGFLFASLSDAIRDELAARGTPVTREALIQTGRELRERHGPDALARRVGPKLTLDRNWVVDSFRNPAEVTWFRDTFAAFELWEVHAPAAIRLDRIRARGRESDPQDLAAFEALEAAETAAADPAHQDLDGTAALADRRVDNGAGLDALGEQVAAALQSLPRVDHRKPWDQYFMEIARVVAGRSNCIKRKVGAVVVKDRRIIATGYNGTPRGARNCNEGGCARCNRFAAAGTGLLECVCSHAEENAIVQSAHHGISVAGGEIYTTFSPCLQCTKMIINAGLTRVVYGESYQLPEQALALLAECGVEQARSSA